MEKLEFVDYKLNRAEQVVEINGVKLRTKEHYSQALKVCIESQILPMYTLINFLRERVEAYQIKIEEYQNKIEQLQDKLIERLHKKNERLDREVEALEQAEYQETQVH